MLIQVKISRIARLRDRPNSGNNILKDRCNQAQGDSKGRGYTLCAFLTRITI